MSGELTVPINTGLLLSAEYDAVLDNVNLMIKSGMLPGRFKSPEQAIMAYQYGKELKLPFITAMSEIFVVEGTPGCSAKIMLGIIKRDVPDSKIVIVNNDDTGCELTAWRPGDDEATPFSFTIEEAKRWGLANRDRWKKDPKGMCRNRCVSMMARFMFMDVLGGFGYTPDELEEFKDKPSFDATKVGKIPKAGDVKEEVTDVTAVEVAPDMIVLGQLEADLKATEHQDILEMTYEAFRELHAEDPATLAEAYDLFELRKATLEADNAQG